MSHSLRPARRLRCRPSSPLLAALVLSALVPATPAAAAPPSQPPNPGGYANTIGPGLYRLNGSDPQAPTADLAPLRHIIGSARFVGIGESLHTVGSFFDMRQRIFRYLVEEMGFRVMGIEAPRFAIDRLDTYIQTCEGSPEEALSVGFNVLKSREMVDFLNWMCEWNRAHPDDRVWLYGFDIQRQTRLDGEQLIAFLERIGLAADDPRIEGIRVCDGVTEVYYPALPYPAELYERCQAALGAVERLFDEEERAIVRRTSKPDLGWARVALVGAQSGQELQFYLRQDFHRSFAARDRGMAYMTVAIRALRFPHARTALWAHNGHLSNLSPPYDRYFVMGDPLREWLGRDYKVIALTAWETHANWLNVGYCGFVPGLLTPNAVEDLLHDLGEPALLVDLDPRGSHPSLITEEYTINGSDEPLALADLFAAIVFLDVTRAMDSLIWPPCH